MTEKEFSTLSVHQQIALITERAVLIGKLGVGDDSTLFFLLDNLVVEVYYRKYRSLIHMILCYPDFECVHPYVPHIRIECLEQ